MQSAAKKTKREQNQSSSELWTVELSRVPFWDKMMPRLMGGGEQKQNYQCSEALLCTVLAPWELKQVKTLIQVRMPSAACCMHQWDLNFMLHRAY